MAVMTVKEYLEQIELLDIKINQKQAQLEELRLLAFGDKSPSIDKPQVQSSPVGDKMENAVIKYVDAAKEISALIDRYVAVKQDIIDEIHSLKNKDYIDLLYKRYVDYMSLGEIADEMNYSYSRIRHLHGSALEAFKKEVLNDMNII